MKYRILIVEDDRNYRFAIREMVPWEEHGYVIEGEAIHGKQALAFLKNHPVDIILTDMSMPLMNGVELTREVSRMYPHIIIIGLSAYDDFEFVKESLKCGAADYILKQDMSAEIMLGTLQKCCMERQQQKHRDDDREYREHELRLFLREGKTPDSETQEYLRNLLPACIFGVMLVMADTEKLSGILSWLRKEERALYVLSDHEKRILLVYRQNGGVSRKYLMEQMREYAGIVMQETKYSESIFVSRESGTGFDIFNLIVEVKALSELKKYFTEQKVFLYYEFEEKLSHRQADFLYGNVREYHLPKGVELSFAVLEEAIGTMMEELCRYLPDEEHLNENFLDVCKACMRQIGEAEWDPILLYEKLAEAESLTEKADVTLEILAAAWNRREEKNAVSSPEILRAVTYIKNHYPEDISLSDVAESAGLSENYLSNLFKAEMNENFTHYLNRIRIEQAKKLMDSTNLKVYEIAEAAGYHNATYFSTIFKKITGMAVTDYRKRRDS